MIGDFVFLGNSRNRRTIFTPTHFAAKLQSLNPFQLFHTDTHTHIHAHTHTHLQTQQVGEHTETQKHKLTACNQIIHFFKLHAVNFSQWLKSTVEYFLLERINAKYLPSAVSIEVDISRILTQVSIQTNANGSEAQAH